MKIAVIITCFNRREKTVKCLGRLLEALEVYNNNEEERISLAIYLTDDACTDGTSEAVKELCTERIELHIVQGDGNCFWAGGMRLAWREALKSAEQWDFFFLLNDDTVVMDNVFSQLVEAHRYALKTYGKKGMYSGITCDEENAAQITYGGDVFNSLAHATTSRVQPLGIPQRVDLVNANILLVSREVVERIGIFPDCYQHACADNDYSLMALRQGVPALVTSGVCGICKNDHRTNREECEMLMTMSFKERLRYISHPLHSDSDYLRFVWRNMRRKYAISWTLRKIRLFSPKLYDIISKARGLY